MAQWAPDLTKYVDPTGHVLAQIQAQLEEINRKLSELLDQQQAAEQHLNCVAQRVALDPVLSRTETWFSAQRGAARIEKLSDRGTVFERLYSRYDSMVADQNHLYRALTGSDGLIRACAKHIETGMKPADGGGERGSRPIPCRENPARAGTFRNGRGRRTVEPQGSWFDLRAKHGR